MSRLEKPKLVKHHVYDSNDSQSFASSSVSCLQSQKGQMFIGTNGDGIFQHLGNGKFDKITFEDGLPSNNIISLAPSSDSLLWVLTKEGVSLVNHINGELKNAKNVASGLRMELKDSKYYHPWWLENPEDSPKRASWIKSLDELGFLNAVDN